MNLAELLANRKLHGRLVFRGLKISIENRKGSIRRGVDPDGSKWEVTMEYPYGYILNTVGADDEHVDCFIGPNTNAKNVYVIHTNNAETGEHDEDKCMLGFSSSEEAKRTFLKHYTDKKFYGGMDVMSFEHFKKKVLAGKTSRLTAGGSLSVGDAVVVDGIDYRGVVKEISGNLITIEFKGAMSNFEPRIVKRMITSVHKI